jgi:ribokinase
MAHLLVIGGASSDTLHFAGQTATSAGGAGMYTAMAAHRSGVRVSLFAPNPNPIPDDLRPVAEKVTSWLGPVVTPEQLGHFEIAYHAGKTTYLHASLGAEASLTPKDLPPNLAAYDCIHITPLLDTQRQLAFLKACRQRGAQRISIGTYFGICDKKPGDVQAIMDEADFSFMNEQEAIALFGSLENAKTRAGKVLFITLGAEGALIIQGDYTTAVDAAPANELDPTGAGDTFCGATIAYLIQGYHPVMAAHSATALAAQMIEQVGPTALLWPEPPPSREMDSRVVIDESQIQRVSQLVGALPEVTAFNFTGSDFPPVGHPAALEYFFTSTLQQFGFWTTDKGVYQQPLIAPINGVKQKGSSYLFQTYLRPLEDDPEFYTPTRQAELTRPEMLALFRADDGTDTMPALDLHLGVARGYGQDMLALGHTPSQVVRQAQKSGQPLQTFLEILDHIGGYKEDPLRKKSSLLALILNQRPEAFLTFGRQEQVSPVIDYHVMRSCLRVGLVEVADQALRDKITARQLLKPADEWAVRYAAYIAIEQVVARSGKSTGAVDWFFFNARQRCPEMTEPVCERCQVDPVCAHRKDLFQPILRTSFY